MLVLDQSALPRCRREPGIGGDLPAIIEVPEQPFRVEYGGTLGADTLEIDQCRCWIFGDFDCQQSVALGLHLFDLGYHQFESVELATDLPLQMFWQCAAVAGPQFLKPMSPVTSQRLVVGDALSKQQALDPVDMAGPLTNQSLAFKADAPMVLLLDARYPNHRAHARLASFVGEQRTHQRLTIDLVGLGTTPPARRGNRGGVDDMAFYPFGLQDSMDPEAVETRLLNDHKRKVPAGARLCLVLKPGKACQQSCDIAAADRMFRLFSPLPGDSEVINQVDLLSSKETKIAPRSVQIAAGAADRSATTRMMGLHRVVGQQPHSARAEVAIHHRSWDL